MQNHVLDYLDETVQKVPNKPAFVDENICYTFREVWSISRVIGSCIAQKGYYKEPVFIYMEKSPKMITAFFGVIWSGCFYVPIDEEMPESRIQLILENCKPRLLICDQKTKDAALQLEFGGEVLLFDDISEFQEDTKLLEMIRLRQIDTDPIYIVFTSGSTGIPKGVCACHRSVIDYIEQLSDVLGFGEDTIFGNQTPLYVDASLKELFPTLKFGATTYLIPRQLFMFPTKLIAYLNEKKINTICWVVSALTMVSAFHTFDYVVPHYLHTIAFGSEVFPMNQFQIWKETLPEAQFFNLYGPTEGTGMCCYYPIRREMETNEVIPIGYPFKNTEILLLTDKNELAMDGEEGEICIRGTSVTLGYYNNFEKTSECFVQNPLNKAYPEIIYRTGDIGKRNAYGELVFVSRKDDQIKHMGHRIELGEIEVNANCVSNVKMSCCIYDSIKQKIVLFYIGEIENGELKNILRRKLPRYMMPNGIYRLQEMPLTANGKINRMELKKYYEDTQ